VSERLCLDAAILVVEDDHDTRELLRFFLEQHSARVAAVDSVEPAMECFKSSPPDLVIADIGLPGYNGFALINLIRNADTEKQRTTPSIALTAYASPADRAATLAAGFDRYLEKPFVPTELLSTIVDLLGRKTADKV
jgi:DNA-binding response OmpR family regulator